MLEEEKIDYKKLAERHHGRFRWIRVRAKRVIGNGDRQEQIDTSDWMMTNLQNIEPATRPIVIQRAFALRTQDPDLAELAVRPPHIILNQQRVIAENEFDTISRRAMVGMAVSPQPDDIHQNHIETHLIDAQALLGSNEVEPWGLREALVFAAVLQHIGEHIQILIGNKATNFEGNKYLQPYQQLIHQSKPVIKDVHQRQQTEENKLTPKEQADIEIQLATLELKAHELGVRTEDLKDLQRIRANRAALSNRAQYVKEVADAERRGMEKAKLDKELSEPKEPVKPNK
jgi:hypothetical protein